MQPDLAHRRCFIALLPPPEIQEYANAVIGELGDRYQMKTAKAPPHVTLQAPFLWRDENLPLLERSLQEFASRQAPVPITLSGFGAFAPRVLYMYVQKTPSLLKLQANLLAYLEATLAIVDPVAKRRSFTPHLTVASRNVTPPTFQQAWTALQSRSAEFEFLGTELTLLVHTGQKWQIHAEFELSRPLDLPVDSDVSP